MIVAILAVITTGCIIPDTKIDDNGNVNIRDGVNNDNVSAINDGEDANVDNDAGNENELNENDTLNDIDEASQNDPQRQR
jgi:hypothetical protein